MAHQNHVQDAHCHDYMIVSPILVASSIAQYMGDDSEEYCLID